ncbi:hypothetical protein BH11PSE11_BH11PSE11_33230 [soil metagenome]
MRRRKEFVKSAQHDRLTFVKDVPERICISPWKNAARNRRSVDQYDALLMVGTLDESAAGIVLRPVGHLLEMLQIRRRFLSEFDK